jgi:hypothetical protein
VLLLCAAALGAAGGSAGWVITDQLESNDEFCVSCHLEDGTPLHERKLAEYREAPAASLAAVHLAAESGFRCIDCHGGASPPNRIRVKLVAARDALLYLAGTFEEPTRMEHPLWDEDCARCHARYSPARDDAFHAIAQHNVDFEVACVSCHRSHPQSDRGAHQWIEPEVVRPLCLTCHEELAS